MDSMQGANKDGLTNFVDKWSRNVPSQLDSPVPGQLDLAGFIDLEQSECLNEHDKYPFKVTCIYDKKGSLQKKMAKGLSQHNVCVTDIKINVILI